MVVNKKMPLVAIGAVLLCHQPLTADPSTEKVDQKGVETFFYNKGYRNGYADGEKEGYAKGLAKAERAIRQYKRKIEAYEAAKYLSKRHKIAPPKVYQKKNPDGTVSVVVKGCTIEKQLTPEEILMLPETNSVGSGNVYNGSMLSSGAKPQTQSPSDHVFLPGIDSGKEPVAELSGNDIKATYLFFPDTEFYRNLFRVALRPFSVISGNRLKVIFPSEKDAKAFCVRHGVTPLK